MQCLYIFTFKQLKIVLIYSNEKQINGKSLISILKGNLKQNDIIKIKSSNKNLYKIKEISNNYGREI